MKTIQAVARTHHGVTIMQTMSGIVVSAAKPNRDLETRIAAVYEQYQGGNISKEAMYATIDQLMSTSASSEAQKQKSSDR